MIQSHVKKEMEEIAISKFKATCLAVMERVRKTRQPVRVTRFGKPVAEIVPPSPPRNDGSWLGCMEGTVEIIGDITGPTWTDEEVAEMEAEMLREWDEVNAIGRRIAERNRRATKRKGRPRRAHNA